MVQAVITMPRKVFQNQRWNTGECIVDYAFLTSSVNLLNIFQKQDRLPIHKQIFFMVLITIMGWLLLANVSISFSKVRISQFTCS